MPVSPSLATRNTSPDVQLARVHVGLHFLPRAHASRDDVAVRMIARLLGRQEPGVDLLLHVRVILGQLHQRAVTQQVHAGVADLSDEVTAVPDSTSADTVVPIPCLSDSDSIRS